MASFPDILKADIILRAGTSSDAGSTPVAPVRTLTTVKPVNGDTVQFPGGGDGMLILNPSASLASVTLALPSDASFLSLHTIASMRDIAGIAFTGGTVLNAPMELLANQAVTLQIIDTTNHTWITV